MTQVLGRDASLEESAVINAADHQRAFRRPRRQAPRPGNVASWSHTVPTMLWHYALEVTGGDVQRIQHLGDGMLLIHNGPWRKTGARNLT